MTEGTKIQMSTTHFGDIEVDADTVITFPQGLVGMPELARFVLIEGSGPLKWLQSLDDADATFVVIDSEEVITDYEISPTTDDLNVVVSAPEAELPLVAMLIVTIPEDDLSKATTNLMAPLIVNVDRKVGVQAVLPDGYPVRHPLALSMRETKKVAAG
ncbi:MAG: flagellar assembly protein FliW [Leptospirillia bacterium]